MGNIYSVKHSQSWNLGQAQSQSTLNTEHYTSMNPQPWAKYILFWPYHSLNKYIMLTCSLPDIPHDALWKTTSIWWLIIFLKSSILVISPPRTYIWILCHKMRLNIIISLKEKTNSLKSRIIITLSFERWSGNYKRILESLENTSRRLPVLSHSKLK